MKLEDRLSNDLRRSVDRFAPRARTVDELIPSPATRAPSGRRRASLIIVGLAIGLTPVVVLALVSRTAPGPAVAPATPSSWILPTNPCALLTADQVSTATGANVLSSGLVPDSRMMIPGTPNPCEYKTDGRFGAVTTSVRPTGKQEFLDLQARDPLNTNPINGLGDAAFMTGGASIFVRVGDGYFSIGVQLSAGSEATAVLREMASRALSNISMSGKANASLSLDPTESLARAQQTSPFEILLPTALPPGAQLERVDWSGPDQNGVMSVDIRWTSSVGQIHLWETNNPSIPTDKDPSNPKLGGSVAIAGQTWVVIPGGSRGLMQIGTRLPSGVTLEIDAQMRDPKLEQLAGSIAASDSTPLTSMPSAAPLTSTVLISTVLGERFDPPPAIAKPVLTAPEAIARFETVDHAFHLATDATVQLGLYTAPRGDGTYRFDHRLAYGIRYHFCNPPLGLHASASPSGPCTFWLFLDANTGKMLEAESQIG